jgi:hypothetical protein
MTNANAEAVPEMGRPSQSYWSDNARSSEQVAKGVEEADRVRKVYPPEAQTLSQYGRVRLFKQVLSPR